MDLQYFCIVACRLPVLVLVVTILLRWVGASILLFSTKIENERNFIPCCKRAFSDAIEGALLKGFHG